MFLLDPTEGLSRDELMQHMWDTQLTPPQRDTILGMAQAHGGTWQELFREVFDQYDVMMRDPVKWEAWMHTHEAMERRRVMPFGPDPRQERTVPHDDR